jgi:hypothetical protein
VPDVAVAEDEWALPSKKSKKEKRKSKATTTTDVAPELEPLSSLRNLVQEPAPEQVRPLVEEPTLEPRALPEFEVAPASKASKKEKRKSKKSPVGYEEEPVTAATIEPLQSHTIHDVLEHSTSSSRSMEPLFEAFTGSTAGTGGLEAPESQTLARKASRKHKLAALFEQGASHDDTSTERELRKGGTGSVKNLAEQYETQSRSVTPVLQPALEKRSVSRVASDARLRSQSPQKDIDFAGTVAAGLKASGFDDKYAVDDKTFHQSSSPQGTRDMTTDDDVAAALDSASSSKFATRGWTTPTSSPKLRPTKESESNTLPPIEVAIASTDSASFDPLDVLNDPTFSKRNTSPGVLEEADPEELGSKLKMNKKSKGKSKRTSLPESPAEAPSSTLIDETTNQLSRSIEPATQKESKKSKKDKKRAPYTQDSVEYTAAETPAVETPIKETPAVETLAADSTVRESKLDRTIPTDEVASLERSTFDEGSVAPTAGKEPGEYPFPQVLVPRTMDARDVGEGSMRRELEQQKEVAEVATPSKKKSKKSRKEKEDSERDAGTTRDIKGNEVGQDQMTHETHKRRSHPVTFEEDQPNEKRPHLREPTPESMSKRGTPVTEHAKPDIESPMTRSTTLQATSTDRGLGLAQEPTWSFSGVEGNEKDIAESSVKRRVPSYDESTRDSGYHGSTHSTIMPQDPVQEVEAPSREKKRRSKEPKTPREKLIRDSKGADSSPSLPEFSPAGAATTPTAQEYATK